MTKDPRHCFLRMTWDKYSGFYRIVIRIVTVLLIHDDYHHYLSSSPSSWSIWKRKIGQTVDCYSWWRHQMETFSALLAIYAGIHRSPVNSPHKGQWRGALMFSLICVWMNGWVNNREAGELRRYRAHYDVIVMGGGKTTLTIYLSQFGEFWAVIALPVEARVNSFLSKMSIHRRR